MKNSTFRIVAMLLVVVCLCIGFVVPTQTTAQAKTSTDLPAGYEEVFSYEDVFAHYYELAKQELAKYGLSLPMSYEQFCEGYYNQDLPLEEYTRSVVEQVLAKSKLTISNNSNRDSSDSPDADYILLALGDYIDTPAFAFAREPNYNGYQGQTFNYSLLRDGDIVYETDTIFFDAGHTAIITDVDHPGAFGEYVQTVEAVGSGVCFGFLDDTRIVQYKVRILRPQATEEQRQSAIYFARMQTGKEYFLDFAKDTSSGEIDWYCSELIYAAYFRAGVDLLEYQKSNGDIVQPSGGALPEALYKGMNTYFFNMSTNPFLEIELMYGNRWKVRVYNKESTPVIAYYNTKMCFQNDATNWTNLSDISSITIPANSYVTVTINERFLCGFITVSCYKNGVRYITYANGLQTGPYHMNIQYNIV